MGLLLFGSPLVIDVYHPGAPLIFVVACGLFVVAAVGMLLSVPSTSLSLSAGGLVYRPPFWRAAIKLPWQAVLGVSIYGITSGYPKQRLVRVAFVIDKPNGPQERVMLLNRLGNLKPERLMALID